MSDRRGKITPMTLAIPRRHPACCAAVAYVFLAALATWPVLGRMTTALAGGDRQSWRGLWGLWWFSDSVRRGVSPLTCDALRWPQGMVLPAEGWNLPAAVAMSPAWALTPRIPEVAIYNVAVLLGYALAGFSVYLLCRELWGGQLAPFLAGSVYTIGLYHLGQAPDRVNVASIASPLYFLAFTRVVRRRGPAPPVVAGAALGIAAVASPGYLILCAVGTVVLLVAWFRVEIAALASRAFLNRVLLLVATFVIVGGWLYVRSSSDQPHQMSGPEWSGLHSADLLSFFVPGRSSVWSAYLGATGGTPGRDAQDGWYVGCTLLALVVAAVIRVRAARAWVAIACAGFVLALGPRLHVHGRAVTGAFLPFGWLDAAVHLTRLGAAPDRFTWLVAFGAAVAAGAVLSQLVRDGRRGRAIACAVTAAALLESWPHPMTMSGWPAPAFLRNLARDDERWAVLDATPTARRLWHQILHGHPQVGGYGPEGPGEIERVLDDVPELKPLLGGPGNVLARKAAIRALQGMNVRFVIVDASSMAGARALRLPSAYEGDGLVVFEVPPSG